MRIPSYPIWKATIVLPSPSQKLGHTEHVILLVHGSHIYYLIGETWQFHGILME